MKTALALLALTFSTATFASNQGTVEGLCLVGTKAISFKALPGEKVALGIFTGDEGDAESIYNVWSVEVANYQGTSLQNHGGLFIALARPIGSRILVNPPILCPTSPQEARERCHRENEARLPKLEVNTDSFEPDTRAGISDFFLNRTWHKNVTDGFATSFQTKVNGQIDLTCIAKFSEI